MSASAVLHAVLLLFLFNAPTEAQWWTVQTSGVDTNLRGVSAAYTPDEKVPVLVVLASGSNGVILKSLDERENVEAPARCRWGSARLPRHCGVQR
ncbi:MAG: hypothetical protein DMG35_07810 [Acidobacteria bacterium]|nr:MAG: hypothetical protein DMG35_07810 [Acidobacteriota bacterium]